MAHDGSNGGIIHTKAQRIRPAWEYNGNANTSWHMRKLIKAKEMMAVRLIKTKIPEDIKVRELPLFPGGCKWLRGEHEHVS